MNSHFFVYPCFFLVFLFAFFPAFLWHRWQISLIQELSSGESNIPVVSTNMHGFWSRLYNHTEHWRPISPLFHTAREYIQLPMYYHPAWHPSIRRKKIEKGKYLKGANKTSAKSIKGQKGLYNEAERVRRSSTAHNFSWLQRVLLFLSEIKTKNANKSKIRELIKILIKNSTSSS